MTELTEAFMRELEALDTFVGLAAGYRQKLEAAGFSPAAAECIAGQYLIDYTAKILRGNQ